MSLDVYLYDNEIKVVYSSNITHNLTAMADAAGIYEALWRPYRLKENFNIPIGNYTSEWEFECRNPVYAKEIIGILGIGLDLLKKDPEHFKKYNSPNGWGLYENFVPFVEGYLNACIEYPDALVYISR